MRCEPNFRVKWETTVSRVHVSYKRLIWICWRVEFLNQDGIPFEKTVAFVRWEEKRVMSRKDRYRMPERYLPVITKVLFVWKNELTKPHESMEADEN